MLRAGRPPVPAPKGRWYRRPRSESDEGPFLTPRRSPRALGAALLAAALLAALGAAMAAAVPAAIERTRAELARVEAQLAAIDAEVGRAAEAYNGARYELGLVRERIEENRRRIRETQRDLSSSRQVLAARLRQIYVAGTPSFAEVVIGSGSIAAATDELELLDRIGERDAVVVSTLERSAARLEALRAELLADERAAERQVDRAAAEKRRVESLLAQRRAVLANVKGELARMIRAEQARQREIARRQKQALELARRAGYSGTSFPRAGANAGAVAVALQQLGTPYVWGGGAPGGFDCSGLASYAYAQIGKSVPHYTVAIWNSFPRVPAGAEEPGDMVFFNGLGHMGIYIGDGQFVHAPSTGDVVKISNMSERSDYLGAVRA